jgi:hypothetical protein
VIEHGEEEGTEKARTAKTSLLLLSFSTIANCGCDDGMEGSAAVTASFLK